MVKRVWRYISGLPGLHRKPREKSKVLVLIPDPSSLRPLSLGNKVNNGAVSAAEAGRVCAWGSLLISCVEISKNTRPCVVCPAFVSFLPQRQQAGQCCTGHTWGSGWFWTRLLVEKLFLEKMVEIVFLLCMVTIMGYPPETPTLTLKPIESVLGV